MSTNYTITVNGTTYDISTFFKTSATDPGTIPTTGNYKFRNAAATFDASFVAYENHPLLTGTLTNFKYNNTDIIKLYQPYYVDYTATTATDVSNTYTFPSWASKVYFAIRASGPRPTTVTRTFSSAGALYNQNGDYLTTATAALAYLRSSYSLSGGSPVYGRALSTVMRYEATGATNVIVNSISNFSYTANYGSTPSGYQDVNITYTKTFVAGTKGGFAYGQYNIPSSRPTQYTIQMNSVMTTSPGSPWSITFNDANSSKVTCYTDYIVDANGYGNDYGILAGGSDNSTNSNAVLETGLTNYVKYDPTIPFASYGDLNQYGLIRMWFML